MVFSLPGISVITLGVENVKRSRHFYEKGLGLQQTEVSEDVVYFKLDGVWLALYPYEKLADYCGVLSGSRQGFGGISLSCNVSVKDDVDALVKQAVIRGATVLQPAEKQNRGVYSAWIADIDGYPWEIIWNQRWPTN